MTRKRERERKRSDGFSSSSAQVDEGGGAKEGKEDVEFWDYHMK